MSRDNHEDSDGDSETSPDVESKNKQQRHEPGFGGFNANDEYEYEEPDRDIDYSSSYSTDSEDGTKGLTTPVRMMRRQDAFSFEEEGEEEYESDQPLAGEPDDWLENEDSDNDETEDSTQSWPLGLIAVAAVALMLLAAGGYGVIQERAETEEELRQLRETLTTVTSLDDAGVSQKALQTLKQSYDGLTINAEALMRENRRLTNAVAELESPTGGQPSLAPNWQ